MTLHEEGYTQLNIAEKLKTNQTKVSRIIQKFIKKKTFERKKGSDRIKLLYEHHEKFMKDLIDKTPKIGSIKLKSVISAKKGIIVSARTIRKVL